MWYLTLIGFHFTPQVKTDIDNNDTSSVSQWSELIHSIKQVLLHGHQKDIKLSDCSCGDIVEIKLWVKSSYATDIVYKQQMISYCLMYGVNCNKMLGEGFLLHQFQTKFHQNLWIYSGYNILLKISLHSTSFY